MSQFSKIIGRFALVIGVIFSTNANASGGVAGATEVTQLLNNGQLLLQVGEAQTQTTTQINQLMQMIQQAQREILHLKAVRDDVVRLSRLAKEKDLANLKKMAVIYTGVHGDLKKLGKSIETRYQDAYQKGLSISEYVKQEGEKLSRKEKNAVARANVEQQIVANLEDDLSDISDLADKIPLAEGTQQSLGLLNTQVNKMLVSLNRVGQIMQASQENNKKAQDEADAALKEQHAAKYADLLKQRLEEANSQTIGPDFDPMTAERLKK